MNHNAPESGPEWAEARSRVRVYLQALQVMSPAQQERVLALVLQRAARQQEESPGADPTALAMKEVRTLSEQWFDLLLVQHERVAVTGLVSLLAIDAREKWPEAFLAQEIPADFFHALRECDPRAVPGLRVASMVPQPFDSPLDEAIMLPLEGLSKVRLPFVAKVAAFVLSGLSLWPGNRLR